MITHQPPKFRHPTYHHRLAAHEQHGTCVDCGRERCAGRAEKRTCYACGQRRAQRRRNERYTDAIHGCCPTCRRPREDWNRGPWELKLCRACKDRANEAQRARRSRRREAGLCLQCGAESGEHARCPACRDRARRAQRERRKRCERC